MTPETSPDVRQVRRAFIEKHIDVRRAKIIEFGAFDYPTYFKAELNVTYVDFFSPKLNRQFCTMQPSPNVSRTRSRSIS
jgi:hypothetical protein